MRYLRDDFSQDLIHRQAEVDALWVDWRRWVNAQKSFDSDPAQQAAWNKLLDDNLPLVQEALGQDIASLRDDEDLLKIYERVLTIGKRRVAAWDGKVYVFMIPNQDVYTQGAVQNTNAG
jgi:hypothetical protein